MNEITAQTIVDTLNEALEADREAINSLFSYRVLCNDALADHPTIQVGAYNRETLEPTPDGPYTISILGIINGLAGVDDKDIGFIQAHVENGNIDRFTVRNGTREP